MLNSSRLGYRLVLTLIVSTFGIQGIVGEGQVHAEMAGFFDLSRHKATWGKEHGLTLTHTKQKQGEREKVQREKQMNWHQLASEAEKIPLSRQRERERERERERVQKSIFAGTMAVYIQRTY